MLYCFLNSDNKEQKYSTLFEALTKCYTPLGESPLCQTKALVKVDFLKIVKSSQYRCQS